RALRISGGVVADLSETTDAVGGGGLPGGVLDCYTRPNRLPDDRSVFLGLAPASPAPVLGRHSAWSSDLQAAPWVASADRPRRRRALADDGRSSAYSGPFSSRIGRFSWHRGVGGFPPQHSFDPRHA